MSRPFLPSLLLALSVLSVPPARAQAPFLEKFALAADRAAALKELIPGTDDYYFYHTLYHQTQGQQDKAAELLKEWEERSSGPNGRRDLLKNRAALLAYDKDPAGTLAWLKEKLSLEFNHQRRTEEARAELPSVLDSALISFAAFDQKALAGTEALENVTDAGLYRLPQPVEKWRLTEIRALLKRLTRPDFPGLAGVIHRELNEKGAKFGDFPIHTLLTSDQLAELQKLRPELINNELFTAAVLTRMRPTEFEDADRDPAVRHAWLERLWAYAGTLNPNANPIKANLLYHLLALDEKQGRLDEARLLAYLKLPRPVAYVNPRYREDRDIWKFPATLDFDPSAFTGTAPVGDDQSLIRRLVIRYLTTQNPDALAPLVSEFWLNTALAEAKLLSGAEQPQKWMSLLSPESLQSLRERVDIEFNPASPQTWSPDEVVKLDVWVKNLPSLLVRIYEINTANVHRTGEEVTTGLDLDGLTANHERKLDLNHAPILRTKQTFAFPELSTPRGVWIVEFIGNGKASRALIRKGGLRPIVRQTSAGTAVTVLDEKLQPVPKAFAMIGPKQFTADDKGLILLPLSTQPGPHKVMLDDGNGFTALETIELQGENYELGAGFHVPRESLLPGNKASLFVRPRLTSNGRPVLLESLEKVKITIASQTLDGTPATAVFPIEKLAEDKETAVEFAVPDRLKTLHFMLTAETKSDLTGVPVQLSANDGLEVNTITTTSGQVSDLHLSQNGGQWVLQNLGLNGEPRPGKEVRVSFARSEFGVQVEVLMKTDAAGTVTLGGLEGVSSLIATGGEGLTRTFHLPQNFTSTPGTIHLKAGQSLLVPWTRGRLPLPGEVSLIELAVPALTPGSHRIAADSFEPRSCPGIRRAHTGGRIAASGAGPQRGFRTARNPGNDPPAKSEPQRGSPMNSRGFVRNERTPGSIRNEILPRGGRPMLGSLPHPALASPSGVHTSVAADRGFRFASPPAIHGEPLRGSMPADSPKPRGSMPSDSPTIRGSMATASSMLKCSARSSGDPNGSLVTNDSVPKRFVPLPQQITDGYLVWKDLPAGTYSLVMLGVETIIRVTPGDAVEGHALTPSSTLQLATNRPLTVTGFTEGDAKLPDGKTDPVLVFHVGGSGAETRVHIFVSRFLPEFDAMKSLGDFPLPAPSATRPLWQPSIYLSTRNIGDEYRYVLDRRAAARFAGNMLAKPGLLINPWEIAVTETEKEVLEELEKSANSELLPKPVEPVAPPNDPSSIVELEVTKRQRRDPKPDLSFLATPGPVAFNLKPDASGDVVISRAALGDRQYVRVVAIDRGSSAVRDFSFAAIALPPRDLRLARQLNPAQHFSQQNRVTVLEQDAAFRFDEALAAQFQAIGHLGAVQQLFFNLTQNPLLNEFSWLLEWPGFDDAKKRALYSQYACHELNFFLQRKDCAFFDAVVQPFLASKRERTFMDDYLLESDLTRYLAPWPYGRLNALERILLAERLQEEQPTARRMAEDWMNTRAVNRGRDMFLFETALRGRALVTDQGRAEGKLVADGRHDFFFDRNMDGTTIDLNVVPQNAEFEGFIQYGIPLQTSDVPLPSGFVPWGGVAGAPNAFYKRWEGERKSAEAKWMMQLDDQVRSLQEAVQKNPNDAKAQADLAEITERLKGMGGFAFAADGDRLWADTSKDYIELNRSVKLADVAGADDFQRNGRLGFDFRTGGTVERQFLGGAEKLRGWDFRDAATRGPISYNDVELHYRNTDGDNPLVASNSTSPGTGTSTSEVAFMPPGTEVNLLARFKARDLSERGRLFRQQDPTKVWAEQQYYKLPLEAQTAGLIPMNRFWRDYAVWDGKGGFLSASVADAAGSFTEMVLALAVLDLPFPGEFKAGKVDKKDNVLTLTPASRLLLFHQDILPAEPDAAGAKLLVSQNFYREGDRYIEQAGEKTDKFVTAEFLTGVVYGCQVVVTNPSSSRQRLDVLFQIPAGALPVKATRRVQSLPVGLEPYRTQTLDFHFYFPQSGKFTHFPVHISRDTKTAASAAPFTFNVVGKPTINDPASWDYVSQHGADNEVLSFLEQQNLYFLDLSKILWRLKDADFFRRVLPLLKSRHHFDSGVWSYAALHNVQPYLTEYLQESPLSIGCGPAFECPLLTVNPVQQKTYQHLEYSPLVNARAHPLGGQSRIMNDKFHTQWNALLTVLAFRPAPDAEDWLAVTSYLATQDRIEEALAFFAKVNRAAVAEKLQYEYLRAWLAMCQEDTATARRIASALLAHPVKRWRDKFAILTSQLDELEGKPAAVPDMADRDASQDTLADKELTIALTSESNMVTVRFRNVEEVTVRYYPVDLEFLFSANPFVTQNTGRFASIRPAHSDKIMLPAGADKHTWALPARFHSDNVLVEVTGGGASKATAVYANALDVQISEGLGQLSVMHDKKPLPKTYVKVFADVNGNPAFYKDGYTDLRGKFDYASLSTDDLNGARNFAILIMSDNHGAVVKEVKPPAR